MYFLEPLNFTWLTDNGLSPIAVTLITFVLPLCIYVIGTVIYNLFLHPLAGVPGPKIAAATKLFEFYYDVIKGGQFFYEIQRMHTVYGPIVRINPTEIHVSDPDYYDTVYAGGAHKRDKYDWFTRAAPSPTSSFATGPHALHRLRRGALIPFFSKRSVVELEPIIHEKVELLCEGLTAKFKEGVPFDFSAAFMSLALDTVTHYSFGRSECWNCLTESCFSGEWKEAVVSAFENATLVRYIPWIIQPLQRIPYNIVARFHRAMGLYMKSLYLIEGSIFRFLKNEAHRGTSSEKTVFSELRTGSLPEPERRAQRLVDEGAIVVIAGGEALTQLLTVTSFYLVDNPHNLAMLRDELQDVMPEPHSEVTWSQLEQLPYLNAIIQEGLRISAIVTTRLPRIAPDEEMQYGKFTIPRGTPVSMTSHFIHLDPKLFPEPLTFSPERWTMDDFPARLPKASRKYLVPFSKGSRQCVGQNLAYAQAYIALAKIFRRFEFELYETTKRDVTIVRDCFNGQPWKGTKGVRMRVTGQRP